jgi:hypothetical protein
VTIARVRRNQALPPAAISGLEWGGNETTNTQRVLRWLNPFAIYDATYIFRVYPKGPKSGSTNPAYWTTFFWGNYGDFSWDGGGANTYYGGHPYPFDGNTQSTNQDWEISAYFTDDRGPAVTWNRWYTQVFRAWRESASITHHEFIFDWDLFVSSNGASGMFSKDINDSTWADTNPPTPSIVVGEAPPNNANTASWGGYAGREQFKGIIRGLQFYDARLGSAASPTVANTTAIANEIATPGSSRTPWYLNLNPTPSDVTDKSGSGHNPSFPGSTPSLWTG